VDLIGHLTLVALTSTLMLWAPAEPSAGGQARGVRTAPFILLAAFGGSQRSQE